MKNYTTLILSGIVIILAVVLVGVLTYEKNQPAEERAVQPLIEIAPMEPDSSKWGVNFPNQFDSFMKTETNNIDTTYAGSSQFSWLERDPRQVILFAGYPFSKDYNDDRGHANLWPRTPIATAALQMIPGVDLDLCRKPEIMADAAWFVLTSEAKSTTGNFFIDDELLARHGVTDLDKYAYKPGTKNFLPDFFVD